MLVSEIFNSFQGEGPTAGKTAAFLRLGGCNLKCTWCDTPYTWNWESFNIKKELKEWTDLDIVHQLLTYKNVKRLILTGGEPLLQQEKKDLQNVLLSMKRENWQIEVETNGTVEPNAFMKKMVDQWNVSPKMTNSGNESKLAETSALKVFTQLPSAHFKLVVDGENEFDMAQGFIVRHHLPINRTYLMPQARTKTELAQRLKPIQKMANQLGCRFTSRLQVAQYGSKRGV